jgi:hypothetical protein
MRKRLVLRQKKMIAKAVMTIVMVTCPSMVLRIIKQGIPAIWSVWEGKLAIGVFEDEDSDTSPFVLVMTAAIENCSIWQR